MKIKIIYRLAFALTLIMSSCADLDVKNINNPDVEGIQGSEEGMRTVASGLFHQWYQYEQHNYGSPGPAMWVMADWGTVTFANYGTRDMSEEPRIYLDNDPAYAYHSITRNFFRAMYSANSNANEVVGAIKDGLTIEKDGVDETKMIEAMGFFVQGLTNGYVGLVFDKAYISDENSTQDDLANLPASSYMESIHKAVEQLENTILICQTNDFVVPAGWVGDKDLTSSDLEKIAHTYIARFLVYSARNLSETNAVDWATVLTHTQAGIDTDFNVYESKGLGDSSADNGLWISWYKRYMARPDWGKVDMRVVNILDNTQPANWPAEGIDAMPNGGVIRSADARVASDFMFNSANNRPDRGIYRWSTYRYQRFDDLINARMAGDVVMVRKAENDLLMAEAYLKLGNLTEASNVINNGTRVTRGHLPTIGATEVEITKALFYERTVELPLTGMGLEYFDMRRNDQLQDGSLLHFPVPAQQNLTIQLPDPYYTFGGLNPQYGTPGVDVAIGGWYKPE